MKKIYWVSDEEFAALAKRLERPAEEKPRLRAFLEQPAPWREEKS